ncbi:MAG TPA: P22 coat - protein 5 family protein [Candidatus Omnitrophota bacterium]|nr:P22 coat - protein 5 family protein [Candidatus Omnitrophota bacterium]
MANNLTALARDLFSAAQEVSQEPVGVINAVNMSFDNKGVAKGDKVKVPVAPSASVGDFTPAMTTTAGTDATAQAVEVEITANKCVSWNLTGEQMRSLENSESDKEWARQMVAQGMRALRNQAEADAAAAVKSGASRAYGTAATTPFASDLSALTNIRKILSDNGAPMADLNLIVDTAAGLNLRNLSIYQQAAMAGSDAERRTGNFLRQFGFAINESAGIAAHTKGTGSSYVTDGATAKGITDVVLKTGSGTVLAGDIVTFGSDTNKYVVNTGVTAAGTIKLGRPGARAAIADGATLTIGNTYTPNLAFERSAVVGVMRPPIMPPNANMKLLNISDEKGLTYLLTEIAGDGMVTWRLQLAWGFKVVQPEHVAILLG